MVPSYVLPYASPPIWKWRKALWVYETKSRVSTRKQTSVGYKLCSFSSPRWSVSCAWGDFKQKFYFQLFSSLYIIVGEMYGMLQLPPLKNILISGLINFDVVLFIRVYEFCPDKLADCLRIHFFMINFPAGQPNWKHLFAAVNCSTWFWPTSSMFSWHICKITARIDYHFTLLAICLSLSISGQILKLLRF